MIDIDSWWNDFFKKLGGKIVFQTDVKQDVSSQLVRRMDVDPIFEKHWYSPNLNLIERLWKFFKKKILYNTYYEKYDDFLAACKKLLSMPNEVPWRIIPPIGWKFPSIQHLIWYS
jgi:hypothetical protein